MIYKTPLEMYNELCISKNYEEMYNLFIESLENEIIDVLSDICSKFPEFLNVISTKKHMDELFRTDKKEAIIFLHGKFGNQSFGSILIEQIACDLQRTDILELLKMNDKSYENLFEYLYYTDNVSMMKKMMKQYIFLNIVKYEDKLGQHVDNKWEILGNTYYNLERKNYRTDEPSEKMLMGHLIETMLLVVLEDKMKISYDEDFLFRGLCIQKNRMMGTCLLRLYPDIKNRLQWTKHWNPEIEQFIMECDESI